jgi:hypothetical protein
MFNTKVPVSWEAPAQLSSNNISVSAIVKATAGTLVRVAVVTAGGTGTFYDIGTTAGVTAGTAKITVIPPAVTAGSTIELNWPCAVGIVYVPGTSQVVSVSYI